MKKFLITLSALCIATFAFAQQEENVQYNQYGVKVSSDPLLVEAQDGIFVARSPQSKYKLWFDCRVQSDAAAFFGEPDYADEISNGFSIRRARFAVKTQIDKNWYGEVDMDMADGCFELKDAIIRFTGLPNTEITVGNFKEFFSIQRNNSSRYLQFMERPMIANALAPSRHIGVNVKWAKEALWLSAGIFGQEIKGAEERTYVEEKSKAAGPDEGLSFTGKFVWMPGWNKDNWGLHIGGAYSYRQPKTSAEFYQKNRFSTRATTSINRKKYIDTGDFGKVSFDHLYTAELAGYWEGFRGEAAYIGDQSVLENGSKKNFGGWYVQGGYLLFGGKQRYDSNGAKFTRVKRGQKWGDIELCGRIEYINLNADAALPVAEQSIMGGSAMAYSLGLNYYINDHVKFVINWQYTDNDRYASGKSDKFYVGYDAEGNKTKNPYKVTGNQTGVDFHMIAARFEINF